MKKPMFLCRFLSLLIILTSFWCSLSASEPTVEDKKLLAKIGKWDGKTEMAELAGPYEDHLQQQIPFGQRSYYLTPWRSYMDTWPASRYLDCMGVVLNYVKAEEIEAVAKILNEMGVRVGRIELGWGSFDYNNPTELKEKQKKHLLKMLEILAKYKIRPLILLNANAGNPCPSLGLRKKLLKPAKVGARQIIVNDSKGILPFYSGLEKQAYQKAYPRIIKIEETLLDDGKKAAILHLSAPLQKEIKPSTIAITVQKYQPLGGTVFADGSVNKASQETLDGWMQYVKGICRMAKTGLGTEGKEDAGFDLEVWNEYTFGSQFLEEKKYYDPPRQFKAPISYSKHGRTQIHQEVLLPMTVDYVNDPKNNCPRVNVISGFSNQRPWESGSSMWPGQSGFSRHYYSGTGQKLISKDALGKREIENGPLNALGTRSGTPKNKNSNNVVAGSYFVPVHILAMPEKWHYGYQTEFMTRDIQPFPGPWSNHHRYSHPGTGKPAQVWKTETNYYRGPFANYVIQTLKADYKDPRFTKLMHHISAKGLLRQYTFDSHKGVNTITAYNIKQKDTHFAILPEKFFKVLKEEGYQLTNKVRQEVGPTIEALTRLAEFMRKGKPITDARPLSVLKLIEHKPRLVYKGDGTAEHPDRFNRDDFAVLPFQLDDKTFAIGYYVVTRNAVHEWNPQLDPLDPKRYDMPPQRFDISLGNIRGKGAKVKMFDPLTGEETPVKVLGADETSLNVQLNTVDYPRFLIVEETKPGVLIVNAAVKQQKNGKAEVSFTCNIDATARIRWGDFPARLGPRGVTGEYFKDEKFSELLKKRRDKKLNFRWDRKDGKLLPKGLPEKFSARWSGFIEAPENGNFTFKLQSSCPSRLFINDKLLVDNWPNQGWNAKTNSIPMKKGQLYPFRFEVMGNNKKTVNIWWSRNKGKMTPIATKNLIPTGVNQSDYEKMIKVSANKAVKVIIDNYSPQDAVRVTAEADKLQALWPRWDWDTRGVTRFQKSTASATTDMSGIKLPKLASNKKPSKFEVKPVQGTPWLGGKPVYRYVTMGFNNGIRAFAQNVSGDIAAAKTLLPVTAPSDEVDIQISSLHGFTAWKIDYELDMVMHPGETEVRQRFWIVPCGEGYLVLKICVSRSNVFDKRQELIKAIEDAVTFHE